MSTAPSVHRSRLSWQVILAIVLGVLLVLTFALVTWLVIANNAQSAELTKAKAQISSLKDDLTQAKNDADTATSQLSTAQSQLTDMTAKAQGCAAASTLYAHAIGQVAQAMQLGASSPAATPYLLQARQDQAAASTLGCELTQG